MSDDFQYGTQCVCVRERGREREKERERERERGRERERTELSRSVVCCCVGAWTCGVYVNWKLSPAKHFFRSLKASLRGCHHPVLGSGNSNPISLQKLIFIPSNFKNSHTWQEKCLRQGLGVVCRPYKISQHSCYSPIDTLQWRLWAVLPCTTHCAGIYKKRKH